MRISCITSNAEYEIKFYEFISPSGITVTSFYQVIKSPDFSLGCFDTLDEALMQFQNPKPENDFIERSAEFFLGEKILISADELSEGVLR
jgi:hypothetical protein